MVTSTSVQATSSPLATPSQFRNGLGPLKTCWSFTSIAIGFNSASSSSSPVKVSVTGPLGCASSLKRIVAWGYSLAAP
jgi:hypothetical protein